MIRPNAPQNLSAVVDKATALVFDANLEAATWDVHVGSDIGGGVPTMYGTTYAAGVRTFSTVGGPFTDWLAACHRKIPSNTGKLSLRFDLKTDAQTLLVAQTIELDTRVSVNKLNYNFSSQFNYQRGGMLQISNQAGGWVDTGIKPGPFTPLVWIPIQFDYVFDIVAHKYSTLAVTISGIKTLLPAALQNLTATSLDWADSCSLQVQQDLNALGGAFDIYLRNAQYIWS